MSKSANVIMPKTLRKLERFFVQHPSPYLDARTVQILLVRQTHDFTILRTEDSRELNTVVIPESIESSAPTVKVAFLASKQKAVENRMYARFLRTASDDYKCSLKPADGSSEGGLCLECPRCILFGATALGKKDYNIKHRIEYSTSFSVERYEDLLETITFNAVGENDATTGQALNLSHNVRPLANFPSVVSLTSVSWRELVLYLKTLLASKSYGAETRVKGDVRNVVLGIVGGFEEIITSLEYSLELASDFENDLIESTQMILEKYANLSASRSDVVILTADEIKTMLEEVKDISIDSSFSSELQKDVAFFLKDVSDDKKKKKEKKN